MDDGTIAFVSGANRGIGLEFARQLARNGCNVVGGYRSRKRSRELLEWADRTDGSYAYRVDTTVEEDLFGLREFIADKHGRLDLLINNAGVNIKYGAPLGEIEPIDIMENFRINVIGPFLTTKILQPLLAKGKKAVIVNITSNMGSIEYSSGGSTPYRISKAALNMLTKNQALAYKPDGIIVIGLHPGWVKTDMGGSSAPLSPEKSAADMIKIIDNLTVRDTGACLTHDGRTLAY